MLPLWNFVMRDLGVRSCALFPRCAVALRVLLLFHGPIPYRWHQHRLALPHDTYFLPYRVCTGRGREAEGLGEVARAEVIRLGQKESSFALGFAGAIGAYGYFLIPQACK